MLDLLATLNLGARSLQTQQQGVTVAGRNLANVNNPAYARERLVLETAPTVPTTLGNQGTGADGTAVIQLRSELVDRQIQAETSVNGFLQAQQEALQLAQTQLGQTIDRTATSADGTAGSGSATGQSGLAGDLSNLFDGFQGVSADPSSVPARQSLLATAAQLATGFNQAAQRLSNVRDGLNQSVQSGVSQVNELVSQIASLNEQINQADVNGDSSANDLLDARQQKLEALGQLVNFQSGKDSTGRVNITIGGTTVLSDAGVADTLQAYDAGGGQTMVRAQAAGVPLSLTSGSLQGTIDARDGALAGLQTGLDSLAASLISQVNSVHATGYSQTGSTGAAFFTGSNASDIQVNSALVENPALLQASGAAGAAGDNQTALKLAQLKDLAQPDLPGQTFQGNFAQLVTGVGQSLASVNSQLTDQGLVGNMLQAQRQSVSGVSVDEEMTNLVRFQRAFEASAHLITTVDQMLQTVVSMGQ